MLLVAGVFKSNAQFEKESLSFGAGIGYYSYGDTYSKAINIRANYLLAENQAVVLNFNYHIPNVHEGEHKAYLINQNAFPDYINVKVNDKITRFNLNAAYHYTFINENEDPFSLFSILGVGITVASFSSTAEAYDESKYFLDASVTKRPPVPVFVVDAGLGVNWNVGSTNAFAEAKINIPGNSETGQDLYDPVQLSISLLIGVRHNFFD